MKVHAVINIVLAQLEHTHAGGMPLWEEDGGQDNRGTLGYFIKMSDGKTMGVITCAHVAKELDGVMDSGYVSHRGQLHFMH